MGSKALYYRYSLISPVQIFCLFHVTLLKNFLDHCGQTCSSWSPFSTVLNRACLFQYTTTPPTLHQFTHFFSKYEARIFQKSAQLCPRSLYLGLYTASHRKSHANISTLFTPFQLLPVHCEIDSILIKQQPHCDIFTEQR